MRNHDFVQKIQAEPSYEGSEPSRAKLGHFNFWAETELDKNCAAAVDHNHIALETMILFKIIAKDSLRTKVRCDINIHGARYF